MVHLGYSALALLALRAIGAYAADPVVAEASTSTVCPPSPHSASSIACL